MVQRQGHGDSTPEFVRGSALLREAYELAARAHDDQRRRGRGDPYVRHPRDVAAHLRTAGFDDVVVVAALLHDVVEDSELSVGDVVERFGVEVGELVAALTEDESIEDWAERKGALRTQVAEAGEPAVAIYAADKLTNVRDARALYASEGERAAERFQVSLDERISAWRADLEMAQPLAPGLDLLSELRSELEALEGDRAVSGPRERG